jgi:hypothetical protein
LLIKRIKNAECEGNNPKYAELLPLKFNAGSGLYGANIGYLTYR